MPFLEGFIFTKLRICAKFRENKVLAKISEFTVVIVESLTGDDDDEVATFSKLLTAAFDTQFVQLLYKEHSFWN